MNNADFINWRELNSDSLLLKELASDDSQFISELFKNDDISKYYTLPHDLRNDYSKLVDFWLEGISNNNSSFVWVISNKPKFPFVKPKKMGFLAFEFNQLHTEANFSYALSPKYRGKGIITNSSILVIDLLKKYGLKRISVDIDSSNSASENIARKLGFKKNTKKGLYDPKTLKNDKINIRFNWHLDLNIIESNNSIVLSQRIEIDAPQIVLTDAINETIKYLQIYENQPKLVSKYFYLLGRIKFNENKFDESKKAFADCNKVNIEADLTINYETFYWLGRLRAKQNNFSEAKMYYNFALEYFSNNPELISKEEINNEINKIK